MQSALTFLSLATESPGAHPDSTQCIKREKTSYLVVSFDRSVNAGTFGRDSISMSVNLNKSSRLCVLVIGISISRTFDQILDLRISKENIISFF